MVFRLLFLRVGCAPRTIHRNRSAVLPHGISAARWFLGFGARGAPYAKHGIRALDLLENGLADGFSGCLFVEWGSLKRFAVGYRGLRLGIAVCGWVSRFALSGRFFGARCAPYSCCIRYCRQGEKQPESPSFGFSFATSLRCADCFAARFTVWPVPALRPARMRCESALPGRQECGGRCRCLGRRLWHTSIWRWRCFV